MQFLNYTITILFVGTTTSCSYLASFSYFQSWVYLELAFSRNSQYQLSLDIAFVLTNSGSIASLWGKAYITYKVYPSHVYYVTRPTCTGIDIPRRHQ